MFRPGVGDSWQARTVESAALPQTSGRLGGRSREGHSATTRRRTGVKVTLPDTCYDAFLVKEAIHHVADRAGAIRGLAGLLGAGGRLLVVMLPTSIEYPLFQAAHERFQALQPDPEDVATSMREAGSAVKLTYEGFPLRLPAQRYLNMVRNRYMSLLSTFGDDELAAGVEEIRRDHSGEWVEFLDRFAFVLGTAR